MTQDRTSLTRSWAGSYRSRTYARDNRGMPSGRRGRLTVAAAAATVLVLVAGCRAVDRSEPVAAPGSTVPVGSSTHTLAVDGRERALRLYRPAGLAEPAALVVMLHGGLGSARQAESAYGWNALADREGFAVAYPEGLDRAWNVGGGCCGRSARTGVDDVAFVRAAVTTVGRMLPIDPRRVYATGMSNGGMMAYRLACDTDVFAAVAPVAATLLGECPSPDPTSLLHIHGGADARVRLDGAPGIGVAEIDGPPVPDLIDTWRARDGCAPPTVQTAGRVTRTRAECPDGRAVELVTVAGIDHAWPGADGASPLDATAAIWRFFAEHPEG
jgi:polyhydroxybutyrate depolymerase